MSKRHLFNSADGLVHRALRGLVACKPSLNLDTTNRVVLDSSHHESRVSLISGGGSGHEPAWAGFVGSNMLAAAVQGDIFASPSTRQIVAAVEAVPSREGTILVITNYTGDCLHFGLANEKVKAQGRRCRLLVCGDDVSVGRTAGRVGRRGLAGQISVIKVMGAAAGAGASLDDVYDLGSALSAQIVSMAATLDHCHVPGRTEHGALADDEVEIGTGPHNEPGYEKLSPVPEPADLVRRLLRHCLDETDADRAYVSFAAGDETVLLVNNFGGMSQLELLALVHETLEQLDREWKMKPVRVYAGPLETSLNAPAFSLSVINLTAAAGGCRYSVDDIKAFLDVRTDTCWEAVAAGEQAIDRPRREHEELPKPASLPDGPSVDADRDLRLDPSVLERMLRSACAALVEAEPDLTRWDTVMGDGDCGQTLKTGSSAVLAALDRGLARSGSVGEVLLELEDVAESKMGGTLGGILGILFVSLRSAVEARVVDRRAGETTLTVWAAALSTALTSLRRYTPAEVGHRTVMDTLIPFSDSLPDGFGAAVSAALAGAEATRTMKPQLGRATYVRAEHGREMPPDPGAWAAMVVIRALHHGLGASE
ncbi:dihydroxyacetone kinase [Ophiocordyceps camponoti-floridani]|uniref:Dihydroxyacetone kinase n=1 Tax=Ophiocordyceps camponoti-floridani TaxID=2030778 RepID=A0A8H4QCN5_9HYPO|nr:dihydroxyacetone kinase [Ophiocordyceps camponoti-floridani]